MNSSRCWPTPPRGRSLFELKDTLLLPSRTFIICFVFHSFFISLEWVTEEGWEKAQKAVQVSKPGELFLPLLICIMNIPLEKERAKKKPFKNTRKFHFPFSKPKKTMTLMTGGRNSVWRVCFPRKVSTRGKSFHSGTSTLYRGVPSWFALVSWDFLQARALFFVGTR